MSAHAGIGEAEVLRCGRVLLDAARCRQPGLYRGLHGLVLKHSLGDEELRSALFRFIDVLPQLGSDRDIATHLAAYLQDIPGWLPGLLRFTARPALNWLTVRQIRTLAQHFLVEEKSKAFASTLRDLHKLGVTLTVDAVGEAVLSHAEADAYRDRVLWQLAQDWHGQTPHVSIKLSALSPRFDPLDATNTRQQVFARLADIIAAAAEQQATVTVDMEHYSVKPLILDLFCEAVRYFDDQRWLPAIALQAYLPETQRDVERLISLTQDSGRRLGIRLVKGAYWDQERAWAMQRGWTMPCYSDKAATDANYEALTATLLARTDCLLPAIAGHNPRSLAVAIAYAQAHGLSDGAWEIQMLHGMAEPLRDAVAAQGLPLRIYVPTGDLLTGIAYLIRRLLENTASNSVLRQTWLSAASEREVLAPPVPRISPSASIARGFSNLPLSDFSQAAVRDAFATALNTLQKNLPMRSAAAEPCFTSRNPAAPDIVLANNTCHGSKDVDAVVNAAALAQPHWAAHTAAERVALLERVAAIIESRRHYFAALQVMECAKPWREADADVAETVDFLRYYGAQMLALDGAHSTRVFPGELNHYRYRARGVAAIIAPWNFPLAILAGMSAAALVSGNACVMKPALPGLLSAQAWQGALLEAGLPAELCPLLIGGPEIGQALVAHPEVNIIAFTGSRAVGLEILAQAHSHVQRSIKQVVCEMGGKNAIIVDSDADLDQAVSGILASAFDYSGQKCSACSRLILVGNVGAQLLPRLTAAAAALHWGDPADAALDHGPLITEAAQQKALSYLAIGEAEARLLWQGKVPQQGWYCPPTIFVDVEPPHRLAREEIFAPILAVLVAPDFNTALRLANDCDYALTGGVYSRLPQHLAQAEAEFHVGNLYLNRPITGARVGVQPFGGVALSGTGIQAGGPDYLKQFLWMQSLSHNVERHGFMPQGEVP